MLVRAGEGLCPRCVARVKYFYDRYCLNCRITWDLKHDDLIKDLTLQQVLEILDDRDEREEMMKYVPEKWKRQVDFLEIRANYHLPF